ncbi:hypothetical protein GCWU000341_00331 [Oribacterium sp. oral taxon 078 str. F0262]|nr:hypothetical protein GCWU000341_00331 [Oribacterium sp. oral taxon 078 str. F0262]
MLSQSPRPALPARKRSLYEAANAVSVSAYIRGDIIAQEGQRVHRSGYHLAPAS